VLPGGDGCVQAKRCVALPALRQRGHPEVFHEGRRGPCLCDGGACVGVPLAARPRCCPGPRRSSARAAGRCVAQLRENPAPTASFGTVSLGGLHLARLGEGLGRLREPSAAPGLTPFFRPSQRADGAGVALLQERDVSEPWGAAGRGQGSALGCATGCGPPAACCPPRAGRRAGSAWPRAR